MIDLYKITGPMVSDSVEYEGCYLDDKEERLLQNEIKWQDNMTPDVCRDYCETFEGSHFYATQVKGILNTTEMRPQLEKFAVEKSSLTTF